MGCWGGRRRPPAAEREPTFPSYLAYSLNGLLGRQAAASSCWERTYLSIVSGVFPEWVVGEAGGGLQLLRENLPFHRIWRIPWMGCWGGRRRPLAAEREPTFPSYLAYSLNGLLGRQAAASSCWERTYLSIVSGVFPEWVVGEAGGGLQLLRENLPFHRIWRIPWMGCWGGRRRPLAAEREPTFPSYLAYSLNGLLGRQAAASSCWERTYLSIVSGVFPEWVVGEAGGGLQLLRENLPFHRIWRIPWMGCWGGRRRPPAAEREPTFPSYLAYSLNGLLGRQAAASSCWERTYLSIVSGVFPEWVVGEAGGGL